MNTRQFQCFRDLVHDLTGVTIADARLSMLNSRVSSRMRANKTDSFDEYLKLLLSNPVEQSLFVDKVTTHETRFFRTPRIWNYLEKKYLKKCLAKNGKTTFRAWSAASSSGEEAYSLAMSLSAWEGARFSIDASDVSSKVVKAAAQGSYQGRNIERFREDRPDLFAAHMEPDGSRFKIRESLKANINFFTHNLFDSPPVANTYDLVLLRNVLIYFTVEDQLKVLEQVARSMKRNAILVIGESETLPTGLTEFVDVEPFIYATTAAAERLAVNG